MIIIEIINENLKNDKSHTVVKLKVKPRIVNSGSVIEINIKFSNKKYKLNPNDKIQITWPSKGKVYLKGLNETFPLIDKINNTVIANVIIEDNKAEIIFTNNINNLDLILKTINFKVLALNLNEGDYKNKTTINIISGSKIVPITIIKPKNSEKNYKILFFLKILTKIVNFLKNMNIYKLKSIKILIFKNKDLKKVGDCNWK